MKYASGIFREAGDVSQVFAKRTNLIGRRMGIGAIRRYASFMSSDHIALAAAAIVHRQDQLLFH